MTAQNKGSEQVIYPVVVVDVSGDKCCALLDTGAGSSYASSAILDHLGIRPIREEFKRIEMMLGSTSKVIGVYGVTISSLNGKFRLKTEVTKVDRGTLLSLDNPKYGEVLQKYTHLERVHMDDDDTKAELPVHIILGTSDCAKINTENKPKIGRPGEPVAEITQFGWTIMSPRKKVKHPNLENEDPKNSKTKTPKLETGLSFINWLESLLLIQLESSTIMNRTQFKSTQVELRGAANAFPPLRGRLCFGSDQKTENAQTISRMLPYGQEKPIRRQSPTLTAVLCLVLCLAWRKSLTLEPHSPFSTSFQTFCVSARAYLHTSKYGQF